MGLPKTITQTLFIHTDYRGARLNSYDISKYGDVLLGTVEVTVDVPQITDEELTNKKIATLRKGREEVTKEFTVKLANIDDQICELLALPNLKAVK